MGTWTNIYNWVISVIGSPPDPYYAGSNYSNPIWNPSEILAYATACLVVLLAFKIIFWVIRRIFGGSS